MDSKAAQKREHILKSATAFVIQQDFNSLTLDAAAKQAGISKGGLLYHFPNKEALYEGLAQYIYTDFTNRFEEYANADPVEKGKWNRAMLAASLWDLEHNSTINIGLFAASMLNPELAKGVSDQYEQIQSKILNDKIDPVDAAIIRLAIDGLYYSELFSIAPLQEELRAKVIDRLKDLTN